jgi:hypothetical protein
MRLYKALAPCVRYPSHTTIRGGMGLGDAIYVQAVARHFVQSGKRVQVCSAWPEVFKHLPVKVTPFTRLSVDKVAHYTRGKNRPGTTQFQDCCIEAGIKDDVPLTIDWRPSTGIASTLPGGKPIALVGLPRTPMGRIDGFGDEILPDCSVIQRIIDTNADRLHFVQVGAGDALFKFRNLALDLSNRTTVTELFDLAMFSTSVLGYCSFMVPLAEVFDKPALFVWSHRIRSARHGFVRAITPKKVLHKTTSAYVFDDHPIEAALERANAIL